jgi:hypothetical protein
MKSTVNDITPVATNVSVSAHKFEQHATNAHKNCEI